MNVAISSAYPSPPYARRLAVVFGAAAVAAAVLGAIALAHGAVRATTTALAVTTVVAGCTFVAGGIVAWLRRPANRTGLLMITTGFALFASSLAQANSAVPFTIGLVIAPLPAALLGHLVLAFPEGRLHSRAERVVIGLAYFDVVVLQIVMLMFMGFEHVNGCPCPENLLFVRDDMQLHSALMTTERALGVALAVCVGVLLVRRWRHASKPALRAVLPLVSAGGVTLALYAISAIMNARAPAAARAFSAADAVALATVPVAFLLGLFNERLARAGVSDLVVELARAPAPGKLRDALARAVGDPSLEVAYWIPESETYVGIDGQPVVVEASGGHAVTVVDHGGRRVAALVHDEALREQPELLDAVASAAGLALENERLQAELRAQLEELRESRARIVEAGDAARRKLERNLHDGAQQRLVALSLSLSLAEGELARDPRAAAELLAAARAELAVGVNELREIARGLHPAILSRGLEVALDGVAARAPVPVELHVDVDERPPEQVEAAAYYVVSEALTNVARYAEATAATVSVSQSDGRLVVEVADDGVGGAAISRGSGLEGLRDRVEAIGGRLGVRSEPGAGTTVVATLPLGP